MAERLIYVGRDLSGWNGNGPVSNKEAIPSGSLAKLSFLVGINQHLCLGPEDARRNIGKKNQTWKKNPQKSKKRKWCLGRVAITFL